jgi:hypothetical protein
MGIKYLVHSIWPLQRGLARLALFTTLVRETLGILGICGGLFRLGLILYLTIMVPFDESELIVVQIAPDGPLALAAPQTIEWLILC